MPERDGYELIAAIRRLPQPHARDLRAIAVTGYAGDDHRARALAAGYDDYLMKPIEAILLGQAISDLLPRAAGGRNPARDPVSKLACSKSSA